MASLEEAIEKIRSGDVLKQNEGVHAVLDFGSPAVDTLVPLLQDNRAVVRAQAAYALAELADPGSSDALAAALSDEDERVRAHAAAGLARAGDPRATDACIRALDDAPDELHSDMTPAVGALATIGLSAVPFLLDIMRDGDETSRLHAQRALELIVSRREGWVAGAGYPDRDSEEAVRHLWHENGDYHYAADAEWRHRAVDRWRQWFQQARGEKSG